MSSPAPDQPGAGPENGLPDDLASLAERLRSSRPRASTSLRHRIEDGLSVLPGPTPDRARVKALIGAFALIGTFLLALGGLVTFL